MKAKDKVNELFTYVTENKKSIIVGVVIGLILATLAT
jgi:predicted negative regulator of RcsB-dependent stress response